MSRVPALPNLFAQRARVYSLACTARNSENGYTREFRSSTYEAPFNTRSELWWSLSFFSSMHWVPLDVYTCPRYRQRAAEKHDESGCSTKLYRLSMEVRLVGALRRKFKTRYMRRHDGGENWVRCCCSLGIYLVNAMSYRTNSRILVIGMIGYIDRNSWCKFKYRFCSSQRKI